MKLIDRIMPSPARVAFGAARGAGPAAAVTDFASRTEIVATAIGGSGPDYLKTAGHGTSGDGGQALYRRAAAEPAHGFKIRSADGTWWEGVPDPEGVNVKAFGAVGNGTTDDSAAIQAAIDYVMGGAQGGTVIFPFAQGETYAIQSTLVIDYTRVGTQTNMVWLRGTGMPDRNKSPAGTVTDKGMIIWTGAQGGTMLELINPLDHKISDIGLHGNDLADYCLTQSNVQGGWGGVQVDNVVLQRSVRNLLRYTGAVDGGRNVWTRCTLRKQCPLRGTGAAHNGGVAGGTIWTLIDNPDLSDVVAGGQLNVTTPGRRIYTIVSADDIAKTVTVAETDAPAVAAGSPLNYAIVPQAAADEALVLYDNSNNVNDQYVNSEFIYTGYGDAVGHAFHVKAGSPDIYVVGGFTKADVSLYQGTGPGVAYFAATNLYAEGQNFYRAVKQINQSQCFTNVRHAGSGAFLDIQGNSNGKPMTVTGGFSLGTIEIAGRDDFPVILNGFDLRSGSINPLTTNGDRTNIIEVGRPNTVAATHSWVAAGGFVSRLPAPQTSATLYPNLARGAVFRSIRPGGASLQIADPLNVTPIEDDGAAITMVLHADGASPVTLAWGPAYRFANATPPASVAGSCHTVVQFLNAGGIWLETGRSEDIA